MLLAIAIIATFAFVEFMALIILAFSYDGLEGVEIWIGLNQYLLIISGFVAVIVALVTLWIIAV